jgi:hypothetical protein
LSIQLALEKISIPLAKSIAFLNGSTRAKSLIEGGNDVSNNSELVDIPIQGK